MGLTCILYYILSELPTKSYWIAQRTLLNAMWQSGWEGSLRENGYMYPYDWAPLLSTWNVQHCLLISYTPIQNRKYFFKKRAASSEDFTGSIFLGFLRGMVAFKERRLKCLWVLIFPLSIHKYYVPFPSKICKCYLPFIYQIYCHIYLTISLKSGMVCIYFKLVNTPI